MASPAFLALLVFVLRQAIILSCSLTAADQNPAKSWNVLETALPQHPFAKLWSSSDGLYMKTVSDSAPGPSLIFTTEM